jgi:hypothetical protein
VLVFQGSLATGRTPVSFHLPLHRVLGAFALHLASDLAPPALSPAQAMMLLDLPSRALGCLAQVAVGMWKRDGEAFEVIRHTYMTST